MRSAWGVPTGVLVMLAGGSACRPRGAAAPPAAAATAGDMDHCWWSTNRSALPPDSVAARFERAFAAVGFAGAARARQADTAWARTAPTALAGAPPGVAHAMWAVAYRRGDSTHYRYFVATTRRARGAAAGNAAAAGPPGVIPLCTAVAREAAVPGVQPPQPTGEEALAVWRRRP